MVLGKDFVFVFLGTAQVSVLGVRSTWDVPSLTSALQAGL